MTDLKIFLLEFRSSYRTRIHG